MVNKYAHDSFDENIAPTIGLDFKTVLVSLEDERQARLAVWDSAGQERFR